MRSLKHVFIAGALVLGLSFTANAGDDAKAAGSETPKEMKNQTHCPVMGGKIDSTAYTDIQGQRVYHCCPMCTEKLTADPDKYFKAAAAEGIRFENIQTVCPVSGMKLTDKSIYTDHEGRRVVFCSDTCLATFSKDPAKHLEKLNAGSDAKSDHKKKDHGDHDHDHDHSGHTH